LILNSDYRSLETLKQQVASNTFLPILKDIFILCHLYEINKLKKECQQFILTEIQQDVQKLASYFPWLIASFAPEHQACQFLKEATFTDKPLEVCAVLSSLGEANYDCVSDQEKITRKFLQLIFEKMLADLIQKKTCFKISPEALNYVENFYQCFIALYPAFDAPPSLLFNMMKLFDSDMAPVFLYAQTEVKSVAFTAFIISYNEAFGSWKKNFGARLETKSKQSDLDDKTSEFFDLARGNKALTLPAISNKRKAIKYYSSALSKNPENLFALQQRGIAYFELEQWENALKDLAPLQLQNSLKGLKVRAECFTKTEKFEAALQDLDLLIPQKPLNINYFLELKGVLLYKLKKFQEAIDIFTILINSRQQSQRDLLYGAEFFFKRAQCYRALQQWTNLEKDFGFIIAGKALETPLVIPLPRRSVLLYELGLLCLEDKLPFNNGYDYLSKAHQINPENPEISAALQKYNQEVEKRTKASTVNSATSPKDG
ncbi:MAG: tetratricopeptide repeat protein, partial [Rhabdochlamydiaceae bacterium]